MICAAVIARDLSAFLAVRVRVHGRHVLLPEGREGAGDERTVSDFAASAAEVPAVAGAAEGGLAAPPHTRMQTGGAAQAASTAAARGHAAAHRGPPAPMVSGRALV